MTEAIEGIELLCDTPIGVEIPRLAAGEPWVASRVAGLQFYDYDQSDGLAGRVRPSAGDRVNLVRAPENPYDRNAIEIWWKNEYRIGHVPRYTAAEIAPFLDEGKPLRGYVWNGGDGSSWSMDVMMIGPAAVRLHGQWIEREAKQAWFEIRDAMRKAERERRGRSLVPARVIRDEQDQRSLDRLAQAVAVFSKISWKPELPPVGATEKAEVLAIQIGCSTNTIHRIAERVGIRKQVRRRGKYAWALPYELTPDLREALVDWCRHPRAIGRQQVRS